MYKPTECSYCVAPLVQPASGRTRRTCPAPACQRQAEADRKARRRRRQAGIADTGGRAVTRAKRGGRYPLVRRMAGALAARSFPHAEPTAGEWAALEAAIRVGADAYNLRRVINGRPTWGIAGELPSAERKVLQRLATRNRQAAPQIQPGPRDPAIVGTLPEPFVRRGRRHGGGGWIELPLPPTPRLIEL